MASSRAGEDRPAGGLRVGPRTLKRWRWPTREAIAGPQRCAGEEWYLIRALPRNGDAAPPAACVHFDSATHRIATRAVRLATPPGGHRREWYGWVQAPLKASQMVLDLTGLERGAAPASIELHAVSERDPKCHPAANIPRWGQLAAVTPRREVVLPSSLSGLATAVEWTDVRVVSAPESKAELRKLAAGAAIVIDPPWVAQLKLRWRDLEDLAERGWVLVGLETASMMVAEARLAESSIRVHAHYNGIMSARVQFSDAPTRGFALQDVFPLSVLDERGGFAVRALRTTKSWRAYADGAGLATLLSCETPWAGRSGDILSAARPVGQGELLITDLPWLAAGLFGPMLAPRLAVHAARMHLGAPLANHVQHWNRWEDDAIVTRDLADLARRYPPLRALRWAPTTPGIAPLGISLLAEGRPRRHVMLRSGRIDQAAFHDGAAPEPMAILMKYLAREVRECSDWARANLVDTLVTWQFDTASGLRYIVDYDSASMLPLGPTEIIDVRIRAKSASDPRDSITIDADAGVLGDGSLEIQDQLTRAVMARLERRRVNA